MTEPLAKILLVEDDTLLLDFLKKKLVGEGYAVVSAMNGQEGLNAARSQPFDLIVLDHILPGINGPEIIKQLKSDPALKHVPVLMLSNVGNQEEIDRVLALGAKKYLIKYTLSLKQIVTEIQKILGRFDA